MPRIAEAALLFALALAVRSVYLIEIRSVPALQVPIVDSLTYHQQAVQIISGLPAPPLPYWQPPLYPWFLAGLYEILGPSIGSARAAQAVLGSLTCVLLFFLGSRLFGRAVGRLAGIAAAVYGPLVFFDGELLAPVLVIPLDIAALLFLDRALEQGRARDWIGGGLTLGLSAIAWPNILLFLPAAAAVALLRARRAGAGEGWRGLPAAGIFIGAALFPIALVTARNVSVGGEWVPISTNGGINFYIGNNADSRSTEAIRPGYWWARLTALPRDQAGILGDSAASAWFFRRSLAWAASSPGDFLALQARKAREFWVSYEKKRNQDLYFNTRHSRLLSWLVFRAGPWGFPFGLVAPLGLAGAWALRREQRALLPMLFLFTQMIAVVLFFVSDRYRLPVVPILIVFAAAWTVRIAAAVRARDGRAAGALALPALVFCALVALAGAAPAGASEAETYLFSGSARQALGDMKGAESDLRRSLALDPADPEASYHLGSLLLITGRAQEGEQALRASLARMPGHSGSRMLLGVALMMQRRAQDALPELARASVEAPGDERAQFHLGQAWLQLGRRREALQAFARAISLEPRYADPYYPLAQLVATEEGNRKRAEELLETAVRLDPAHPRAEEARRLLGARGR